MVPDTYSTFPQGGLPVHSSLVVSSTPPQPPQARHKQHQLITNTAYKTKRQPSCASRVKLGSRSLLIERLSAKPVKERPLPSESGHYDRVTGTRVAQEKARNHSTTTIQRESPEQTPVIPASPVYLRSVRIRMKGLYNVLS